MTESQLLLLSVLNRLAEKTLFQLRIFPEISTMVISSLTGMFLTFGKMSLLKEGGNDLMEQNPELYVIGFVCYVFVASPVRNYLELERSMDL